jgi:hypothetical protein
MAYINIPEHLNGIRGSIIKSLLAIAASVQQGYLHFDLNK